LQLSEGGKRKRPVTHVEGIPIAFLAQLTLKDPREEEPVCVPRPFARRRDIQPLVQVSAASDKSRVN
jgi:hypothetical protein